MTERASAAGELALRELIAKSRAQMLAPAQNVSRPEIEALQYQLADALEAALAAGGYIYGRHGISAYEYWKRGAP